MTRGFRLLLAGSLIAIAAGQLRLDAQPPASSSSSAPCDGRLKPSADDLGYRQRDDRCEGVYRPLVSGPSALSIVSMIRGTVPATLEQGVLLSWPLPTDGSSVAVRLDTLGPRVFYRLDLVTTASRYRWPTALFARAQADARRVGVSATITREMGRREETIQLPVRVGPLDTTVPARYVLKVVSHDDLANLKTMIVPVDDQGQPKGRAFSGPGSDLPYQAGDQPLELTFDMTPRESGYYRVTIAGTLVSASSGSTTLPFVFYHER